MSLSPLIALLQHWVGVPSVNPELSADPAIAGEERYANVLAAELESRGFRIEWHRLTPGRPNFIARRGPAKPRRRVLLEAHLDTQGVEGMTVEPFAGAIRDGRLYGRGACDQKGPTAAAVHALTPDVLRALADAGVELLFVGAMGEERGNLGAEQLVGLGIGADEALILEPTDLNVVHAHKGAFWFEVSIAGRAAHGSNPRQGVNAIDGMAAFLPCLRQQAEAAALQFPNALLGAPTVNVGTICGGQSTNIVAPDCRVEVDRRMVPGETSSDIIRQLRVELSALQRSGVVTNFSIRVIKDGRPFETAADSALVRRLVVAAHDDGVVSRTEGASWFSDAGPFAATCNSVAVFGPGSILQAHTADEFIDLDQLERGARIFERFYRRLADDVGSVPG